TSSSPRKRGPGATARRSPPAFAGAGPGFPLARRAVRGKFLTALPTSPHDEWYTLRSSCPALCRASTSLSTPKKDVDGRDKPGHDDEREASAADLQPHFFPRTARRASGHPGASAVRRLLGPRS